jgi:hypothetical protein
MNEFDRQTSIIVERLADSGIAYPDKLRGCTPDELDLLEAKYSVQLPEFYRWYLLTMGRDSGLLLACDHYAATYDEVLENTSYWRTFVSDCEQEDEEGESTELFHLPENAFVINNRLGEQFEYIRCNDTDDSPVWYFNSWEPGSRQHKTSIYYWLLTLMDQCEAAIKSGYFEEWPLGTRKPG